MHDLNFSNNRNLTLNHSYACPFDLTKFDLGCNVVDGVWCMVVVVVVNVVVVVYCVWWWCAVCGV
jgi:hypothetical protein